MPEKMSQTQGKQSIINNRGKNNIKKKKEGDRRIILAEKDRRKRVELKDIKAGYGSPEEPEKTRFIDKLSYHQKLLYELVKKKEKINSGELWKAYLQRCKELQKQPLALRTFSKYMNKLIEMELVQWDRALVKGKVRSFRICD